MGEWTPGPWTVGYRSMDVTGLTEKGQMKICDIRGWGHLTGKGHGALGLAEHEAIAIQEANARLIAAAPDLYEALQQICFADRDELNDACAEIWARAKDALNKVSPAAQRDMEAAG